ncbi:hypothetical protein ARTHRO9AX_220337 [Arthrobacter sp. 9AX]|nr:hypothetical protein ARTHRO9AX_220337 [Arthrobacter sp. 9AX]
MRRKSSSRALPAGSRANYRRNAAGGSATVRPRPSRMESALMTSNEVTYRHYQVGETVQPFTLPRAGGGNVTLDPSAAPATVLVWTCNPCPYALAWHDRIQTVIGDYSPVGSPSCKSMPMILKSTRPILSPQWTRGSSPARWPATTCAIKTRWFRKTGEPKSPLTSSFSTAPAPWSTAVHPTPTTKFPNRMPNGSGTPSTTSWQGTGCAVHGHDRSVAP